MSIVTVVLESSMVGEGGRKSGKKNQPQRSAEEESSMVGEGGRKSGRKNPQRTQRSAEEESSMSSEGDRKLGKKNQPGRRGSIVDGQ